ncbi:MAG: Rpn family recombination-promoting nuclease/putative transposase [Lachnospiraceae bacterium]|nr:Rpn family recombination-promoting nuclease/putative transposase [Lachnospiraceae bacterium]
MGQKNNVICSYLSDAAVFADFINGSIHSGEKVVSPDRLSDRETVSYSKEAPFPGKQQPKKPAYIERRRDSLKAVLGDSHYIVIGIEAQNKVDHAMPVRCMEYDVTEYKRQLTELKNNRKEKLPGEEFFSGMAKDEKLNPVTTIVFYHGENPYDGCTNLHDMLELDKENQTFKRLVSDYHMNLIRVEDLDETLFETGMQELVGFLKRQGDKKELMDYIEKNRERIEDMDEETFDAVTVLMSIPKKFIKKKEKTEGDSGMCTAMKEWLADERNAGIMEGEKRGEAKGEIRGKKIGEKIGIKKGEKRFASLTAALMDSERLEDLGRAVSDETFRDSLYREFAL